MIKPAPLKKGDKIAFIAPSSPTIESRIKPSIEAVENLGLKVILGDSCKSKHGYLSGTDEVRARDLNEMFKDDQIKGIFAIRGGYGASRILHMLDYTVIKNNPKIFVGYSDVTILHIVLNQKCNLITYHGPMPSTELYKNLDSFTKYYFINSLFSSKPIGNLINPSHIRSQTLYGGDVNGPVIGGNLSLICSSLGTEYEIDTKDKILFLEAVEEEPYRIDRMLLQLKQAGKFKDAIGIVFGAFTNCNAREPFKSLTIKEILNELILPEKKPSICNVCCGHCLPTITLPLGAMANLNADKQQLNILE
jgi:muramoyltetrapeptide carboxypeptidase